ncbi:MAG: hypothetical protein AAGF07_04960 [Patescibacteria group bacterium]
MEYSIKNNNCELSILSEGALITSWEIINPKKQKKQKLLYKGSSLKRTGIPILFPFANPLQDNIFTYSGHSISQHGFARNSDWSLGYIDQNKIQLSLNHSQINSEIQLAYPFEFELKLNLVIEDNNLIYSLQTKNTGSQKLPIAPGIHPYFPIQHSQKNNLKIEQVPEFEANSFDWENIQNGTFFDFNGLAEIEFPDKKLTIDSSKSDIDFQHLVVWSQNQSKPDSDFVCFEPFSRSTNAINTNPILIKPGELKEVRIRFAVEFTTH